VTFPRIVYTYALELITARGPLFLPDSEIAAYCGLGDVASSRKLLADLADRGDITIRGAGADRVISLGRQKALPTPAPRPIRSVTKPKPSEDEVITDGLAKIKAAVERGKAAVAPKPVVKTPAKSVLVAPVAPAPVEAPAPHPVMAELDLTRAPEVHMERLPTSPRRAVPHRRVPTRHRQVSFWLTGELFDRMEAEARALDIATGTYVRRIVEGTSERPRIPAKVASAAARAGVPVLQFAAEMMERGLTDHMADRAREHGVALFVHGCRA